jgi:F420-dependent oxidoreductase-like protein
MRIGIFLGELARCRTPEEVVSVGRAVADDGFATAWAPQVFDWDALIALSLIGSQVDGIELGTAVIPTFPRHPMLLAQQAMSAQLACGGRLALGIGLSHQIVIEGMFGYSFEKPVRHMREYLEVLLPLLRDQKVSYKGETVSANGGFGLDPSPFPVLLAALGAQMLKLAGSVADGTVTWMVGPSTLSSHVVPSIAAAAEAAGRPAPRVVVGLPVCVTDDPASARERAAAQFSIYGNLPSYRAMLDKEGAEGPADVAVVGAEDEVLAALTGVDDAGATDFCAAVFGNSEERARTTALLKTLL